MSAPSVEELWGPGAIGFIISIVLYGVSVGQFVFYIRAFPKDIWQIRILVFLVFFLDNFHTFSTFAFYWRLLLTCRRNPSYECTRQTPVELTITIFVIFFVTGIVQSFYAHRVWIVSDRNKYITSLVLVLALLQFVFGIIYIVLVARSPTYQTIFETQFSPASAVISAICDSLITGSIFYYLRPSRTGTIRKRTSIKHISDTFVEMGVLSTVLAVLLVILFFIQNGNFMYLTAVPGSILSKTYVNSMLAVLNARKPIRDPDRQRFRPSTVEVPTIPTILSSRRNSTNDQIEM